MVKKVMQILAKPMNPEQYKEKKRIPIPGYRASKGHAFNPLLNYPRNMQCFCGSGSKAKKCCLPKIAKAVPIEEANKLMKFMEEVLK